MIETTVAAAMQLRVLVRSQGVTGTPGVRILAGPPSREPGAFELVTEDQRQPGDEVYESRGIRFYLGPEVARRLDGMEIHLDGDDFVLRPIRR